MPKKLEEIKVYGEVEKNHKVYLSFDFNGFELTAGIDSNTLLNEEKVRDAIDNKIKEYKEFKSRCGNMVFNKAQESERVHFLINYAVHKVGLKYGDRTNKILTIENEFETRVKELAKAPIKNFKEAAEEIAKEIAKIEGLEVNRAKSKKLKFN